MATKKKAQTEGILGGETALGVPSIPLSEETLPMMIMLVEIGEINHHEIRQSTSATLLEWVDRQKDFIKSGAEFDEERNAIPVDPDTMEEVVRVMKTGLAYTNDVPEEIRTAVEDWMEAREDEIDIAEGRDPEVRKGVKQVVQEIVEEEIPETFEEQAIREAEEAPVPLFLESGGKW